MPLSCKSRALRRSVRRAEGVSDAKQFVAYIVSEYLEIDGTEHGVAASTGNTFALEPARGAPARKLHFVCIICRKRRIRAVKLPRCTENFRGELRLAVARGRTGSAFDRARRVSSLAAEPAR